MRIFIKRKARNKCPNIHTTCFTPIKNPKKVITFIGYACLLATAIFVARETSRLIRSIIEATLGKPQLIREITRKHFPWSVFSFIAQFASYFNPWACKTGSASVEESFDDLILPQELKEQVLNLAYSAQNARSHNAPF